MSILSKRVRPSIAVSSLALCGVLATLALAGIVSTDRSSAWGGCTGNTCLPVGSYTLDDVFDCGQIASYVACYSNGTTNQANAVYHHFGWGSSAYNGSGNSNVNLEFTVNTTYHPFGGSGTNLIRACYYASCTPQTTDNGYLQVDTETGPHTIFGHGKA
jgi:hypothetical protein